MEHKLRRKDSLIEILMKPVQWFLHRWYDIHIENGENFPKEGPALILPKHRSKVDIPLEAIAIYETTGRYANYVHKLMKPMPINRFYEKLGGIVLIRPKDLYSLPTDKRRDYLKKARDINDKSQDYLNWLYGQNELLVVHPEGERTNSKDSIKFNNGFYKKFVQYVRNKQIPIIPVGIEYEKLHKPGSKVYIRVGGPINLNHDNSSVALEEIYNRIKNLSGIQ